MHRYQRVIVIERCLQPQRADRRPKAPTEVTEPLDEMRRQPEIIAAKLPVVFALAQRGIGKRLAIRVD